MNRLEERAKPLLIPLIDGVQEFVHVSETDRHIIATWAFKTAIILNSASNFHANVPSSHFDALFRDPTRPAERVVVFGQQHHGDQKFNWLQSAVWQFISEDPENQAVLEELSSDSYKISLQLGKLLLLVSFWPTRDWQVVFWKGIHIPLFPTRGPAMWFEEDPIPTGFSWHDANDAQIEFHVTPALRRMGSPG